MPLIRPERAGEARRIFEVEAAAFGKRAEAELVDALRAGADPFLSLVAEEEGEIVGHVFLSPVGIEVQPEGLRAGALGPIGVWPARQGAGIGSALVRAGLERSRELGWRAVFLVGNPAYYSRFGFVPANPLGFQYGKPAFEPAFQVAVLEEGALEGASGRVHFHPAFAEAEEA